MPENGGTLGVELASVALDGSEAAAIAAEMSAGEHVRLMVSDTGAGIPPELLERIFDPFFTTKLPGEGTGLGLSVVHGIVAGYGGGIRVRSEVGEGTCFEVYIPFLPDNGEEEGTADGAELPRGAGERVLFVDDEESLLRSYERLLPRLGYKVQAVADGRAAIDAFRADPSGFAVVVTDLTMPGMTGVEVAREILAIRPNTPIILSSGYADDMDEEHLRLAGVRELLHKPLNRRSIAETLARTLGRS
jgi:CheY-like chemotaxis protein